jgi:drug/metabolite transporter (DMT)-like permease
MDHIFRETIAAIGGILFIIIGIVRQRERKRLLRSGKKTEGPVLWSLFIFVGVCLLIFAFGLMIYQLSNHKN